MRGCIRDRDSAPGHASVTAAGSLTRRGCGEISVGKGAGYTGGVEGWREIVLEFIATGRGGVRQDGIHARSMAVHAEKGGRRRRAVG
eukprot:765733-Hanusia_phi.AAC.1